MGPHPAPSTSHLGGQHRTNPGAAPPSPRSSQETQGRILDLGRATGCSPARSTRHKGRGTLPEAGILRRHSPFASPPRHCCAQCFCSLAGRLQVVTHARLPKFAQCPSVSKAAREPGRRLQGSGGGTSVCCRRARCCSRTAPLQHAWPCPDLSPFSLEKGKATASISKAQIPDQKYRQSNQEERSKSPQAGIFSSHFP